ncbi:MAG: hypothetical protein ACXWJU_02290, partial [Hyphomicrobium sp.]
VASCGVLLFACAASGEEKPRGYEVITGFDAAPQSLYWYDGAIVALNGPDGSVDGDTGYNAQRLGGFAKYTFTLTQDVPLKLTLVAGHQFVSGSGDSSGDSGGGFGGGAGTYATIDLDASF